MLAPIKQALRRWAPRPWVAAAARAPLASVAINMRPTSSSWGGGNQWLAQMVRYLSTRGYAVQFDLGGRVDVIVIVDPRVGGLIEFGLEAIVSYRQRFPDVDCVHRVNECDARKGTNIVDRLLAEVNGAADFTVFVSEWLREYHASRWFDRGRPHAVVANGADPAIFHPVGADAWAPGKVLRLVTHHWSDNWNKGFDVYQEVDRLIAAGRLPDTELWVIGRWPKEIRWRTARTYGPTAGEDLGALLRRCHVYLTASRFDPGPMHSIEGVQCGLPIVYHEDGGGAVELGRRYGIPFRDDVRSAIVEARERYGELRARVLDDPPSGDRMCVEYGRLLQRLCALNGTSRP
jgi:glycosyltransferase involved in cell wall biosynthesis